MDSFIKVVDLVKEYRVGNQKIQAANGINFEIMQGEFAVVLGPSGSGKSTVLNILGGMDRATSGKVYIGDKEICSLSNKQLNDYRRHDVGFIFQFYNLLPNLTSLENVDVAARLAVDPIPPLQALEMVRLTERKNNFPSQLSGGEQQRTSIARAISKNPKIMLCDEPTGALDSETGKLVLTTLYELCKKNNQTIIVVTHNSVIAQSADRVIYLKDGKVIKNEINTNAKPMSEVIW